MPKIKDNCAKSLILSNLRNGSINEGWMGLDNFLSWIKFFIGFIYNIKFAFLFFTLKKCGIIESGTPLPDSVSLASWFRYPVDKSHESQVTRTKYRIRTYNLFYFMSLIDCNQRGYVCTTDYYYSSI